MTNIDGKIILARYDGIFEFDGENFIESKKTFQKLINNKYNVFNKLVGTSRFLL